MVSFNTCWCQLMFLPLIFVSAVLELNLHDLNLKKRSPPPSIPLIAFVQFIFCSLQLLFLQSRLWSARPLHSTAALSIMSEVGVAIDYFESDGMTAILIRAFT